DFGVPLPESVNRPRFGNAYTPAGSPLLAVEADFRQDVADAVRARGLALATVNSQNYGMGSFEGIYIDPSNSQRTARGAAGGCSMPEAVKTVAHGCVTRPSRRGAGIQSNTHRNGVPSSR